ncbi:hypothetical protein Tco_0431604 [Tanacetum coccineum]
MSSQMIDPVNKILLSTNDSAGSIELPPDILLILKLRLQVFRQKCICVTPSKTTNKKVVPDPKSKELNLVVDHPLKNMVDRGMDQSKITRKTVKNGQARTRESEEYKAEARKVKPQSKSAKKNQSPGTVVKQSQTQKDQS